MRQMHRVAALIFVAACAANSAWAQDYPTKPIRIVTSPPGGGGDFVTRLIAQGITVPLGQPVIVDNRPGILVPELVAKSPPDGYTLMNSSNLLWLLPFMQSVAYDPIRDFSPVALTVVSPNIVVVHPSLPAKSIRELIAFAKARPGQLNFAAGTTGGASHLASELFKSMAGLDMVYISYRGAAPALNDTIGGQVHILFSNLAAAMPHVKSGRLRALGVTSAQPTALAPGFPTVASSGLPGYEAEAIYGVVAPVGTPAPIINRLNQEIVRSLNRQDIKDKFFASGADTVGGSPQQLSDKIKSEMARMGKVIKNAGIRGE